MQLWQIREGTFGVRLLLGNGRVRVACSNNGRPHRLASSGVQPCPGSHHRQRCGAEHGEVRGFPCASPRTPNPRSQPMKQRLLSLTSVAILSRTRRLVVALGTTARRPLPGDRRPRRDRRAEPALQHRDRGDRLGRASDPGLIVEIYRSRDGRWSIERHLDRYLVYDNDVSEYDEVWSCTTVGQLRAWLTSASQAPVSNRAGRRYEQQLDASIRLRCSTVDGIEANSGLEPAASVLQTERPPRTISSPCVPPAGFEPASSAFGRPRASAALRGHGAGGRSRTRGLLLYRQRLTPHERLRGVSDRI
jgi:hypothetical protein